MQTSVLWSYTQPCTSTPTNITSEHDVIRTSSHSESAEISNMKLKTGSRSNIIAQVRVNPVIYALMCLLLIVASDAAPLHIQQDLNGLQNSLIYSSLVRSAKTNNPIPVRPRRAIPDEPTMEDKHDKMAYPRICYFSPIQCLFSSSNTLNNRRR